MQHYWAINPKTLADYRQFKSETQNISQFRLDEYLEKLQSADNDLNVVNGTAIIPIQGVLSNYFNFCDFLYDGYAASYQVVSKLIKLAEGDSGVNQIQMQVNSPGGRLDGLFDLLYVLKAASTSLKSCTPLVSPSVPNGQKAVL